MYIMFIRYRQCWGGFGFGSGLVGYCICWDCLVMYPCLD